MLPLVSIPQEKYTSVLSQEARSLQLGNSCQETGDRLGRESRGQEKRRKRAWGENKCAWTDHFGKHGASQLAQEAHVEGHP
jgi:hypothetical protein